MRRLCRRLASASKISRAKHRPPRSVCACGGELQLGQLLLVCLSLLVVIPTEVRPHSPRRRGISLRCCDSPGPIKSAPPFITKESLKPQCTKGSPILMFDSYGRWISNNELHRPSSNLIIRAPIFVVALVLAFAMYLFSTHGSAHHKNQKASSWPQTQTTESSARKVSTP